jgi:hypothetical protein
VSSGGVVGFAKSGGRSLEGQEGKRRRLDSEAFANVLLVEVNDGAMRQKRQSSSFSTNHWLFHERRPFVNVVEETLARITCPTRNGFGVATRFRTRINPMRIL